MARSSRSTRNPDYPVNFSRGGANLNRSRSSHSRSGRSRSSHSRSGRSRRRFWLFRVSVGSALLLMLIWALQFFVGERTGWTALLTYVPGWPWGALPLVLLLICAWDCHWKLVALHALSLGFWVWALLGFEVPQSRAHPHPARSVRVMSWNVALRVEREDEFLAVIDAQNPDILCLQEAQISGDEPEKHIGGHLRRRLSDWNWARAGDVMTFSRFPLLSHRSFPLRDKREILETVWQTPSGPLRVLNVHVSTSFEGRRQSHKRLKRVVWQVVENAGPTGRARLEQIAPIRTAIKSVPQKFETAPLVVIGDFNTPPRGLFYRALRSDLNDAFSRAGFGIGPTFPTQQPLLRIDYIFLGPNIGVSNIEVEEGTSASDHLPVVADLVVSNTS